MTSFLPGNVLPPLVHTGIVVSKCCSTQPWLFLHKMSCLSMTVCRRGPNAWFTCLNQRSSIHTTSILAKNKQAGRHRPSPKGDKPLTYEMANFPHTIAVRKGWNSWNTSALEDTVRRSETVTEDFTIRRFITGTWHRLFISDIIIKRRGNMIIVSGLVVQSLLPRKMYFLIGYTEEILSYLLKCPVKMEIQTLSDRKDVVFKYI